MLACKRIFELLVVASVTLVSARSFAQSPPQPPVLLDPSAPSGSNQCSDGIDNDGDGLIDYGPLWSDGVHDPGCANAYDNVESTGTPTGTTLRTCSATVVSNTTYDRCNFTSGVSGGTTNNVHITNSKIVGKVSGQPTNLVIEDTDLDMNFQKVYGQAQTTTFNTIGYTCNRCESYNGGSFTTRYGGGGGFTVTQSLMYDAYDVLTGDPSDSCTHGELFQDQGTNPTLIDFSRFVMKYHASTKCKAVSGVGVWYSHGAWGNTSNKTMKNSRLELHENSWVCVYYGCVAAETPLPTNMHFENNTYYPDSGAGFGPGCGSGGKSAWYRRDPTNTWTGNKLDNGNTIPEPSNSCG